MDTSFPLTLRTLARLDPPMQANELLESLLNSCRNIERATVATCRGAGEAQRAAYWPAAMRDASVMGRKAFTADRPSQPTGNCAPELCGLMAPDRMGDVPSRSSELEEAGGAMYYFDGFEGTLQFRDEEGRQLPDLECARNTALEAIREMLAAQVRQGRLSLEGRLLIRDESGTCLMEVRYADAVVVGQRSQPSD